VWGYVLKHHDTVYVSETAEPCSYDYIARYRRAGDWSLVKIQRATNWFATCTAVEWASLWHICFEDSCLG